MSLTHLDAQGRARMVDVGEKAITRRIAVAEGNVLMDGAEAVRSRYAKSMTDNPNIRSGPRAP